MIFAPADEGIVFAFFECEFFGDVAEADFVDGSCADHQCGRGVPVRRDVAAANDGHRLWFVFEIAGGTTGRGFFAFADEVDQTLAHLFVIAELEGASARVCVVEIFGVSHFIGLSVSVRNTGLEELEGP